MKTDIKKLLELAGVPMDSVRVKKLIEDHQSELEYFYVTLMIVGRSCEEVEQLGKFSQFDDAIEAIKSHINRSEYDEYDEYTKEELNDIAAATSQQNPSFITSTGKEVWDIGTDQTSYSIMKGEYPNCSNTE